MNKLKLLVTISEETFCKKIESMYDLNGVIFKMIINGSGTATSSILNYFGLAETKKYIILGVVPDYLEKDILKSINEVFNSKVGSGIAFSISLSSANKFLIDGYKNKDFKENGSMNIKYHLIITIVLEGYLEQVMSAAKKAGAQGGTVIRGRGLGNKEATKIFGFEIEPGRELVLNVVPSEIKNKVMEQITKKVGIKTPCKGICLSVPVDDAIGLDSLQIENSKLN